MQEKAEWLDSARKAAGFAVFSCIVYIESDSFVSSDHFESEWLTDANDLARLGKIDEGLDIIYANVLQLAEEGRFSELDAICSRSIHHLEPDISLGILCATLRFRDRLQARSTFFSRVETYFEELGILEPGLLTGLS